jgi:inorganic pyrophosphatase
MSLNRVDAGRDAARDVNVIIEIPMHSDPIKYEVDKATGALFVDRFVSTSMHYPCNYGYIPQTLSEDGDPVDVLVVTPFALVPGVVVRCRPIGLLKMTDEAGRDVKLLAVPIEKLTPLYRQVRSAQDLPELTLAQVEHFFAHYKELEPGKWVKVEGWGSPEEACREIEAGMERFRSASAQGENHG